MASTDGLPRPRLHGVIHKYAAVAFTGGFVALIVRAGDAPARGWITVYALSIIAMLAVSAVYHSGRLSGTAHRVCKRIDHSTILLAIAPSTGCLTADDGTPRPLLNGAVLAAVDRPGRFPTAPNGQPTSTGQFLAQWTVRFPPMIG